MLARLNANAGQRVAKSSRLSSAIHRWAATIDLGPASPWLRDLAEVMRTARNRVAYEDEMMWGIAAGMCVCGLLGSCTPSQRSSSPAEPTRPARVQPRPETTDESESKSERIAALARDEKRTVIDARWSGRDSLTVRLEFTQVDDFREAADLSPIVWISASGPHGGAGASVPLQIEIPTWQDAWRFSGARFSFDPTNYDVRAGESALGIRFAYTNEFPGGWSTTEYLHLIRLSNGVLTEILRLKTSVDDVQRGPNEQTTDRSIVSVMPGPGAALRDVLVRTETRRTNLTGEERAQPESRSVRYRWDGKVYIPDN